MNTIQTKQANNLGFRCKRIPSTIAMLIGVSAFLFSLGAFASKNTFNIDDYKGKVVYLDFWASWCSPCRQSFPFMNDLHEQFKDQGLAVVSINLDKDPQKAAEFLEAIPANFEVIYDQEGILAKEYQLKAMPSSYIYDRSGKLLGSHLGFKKKDVAELTASIKAVLAQK